MKLIFHIFRKDVARLRWWLLLWVVVLALPVVSGFVLLAGEAPVERGWIWPNVQKSLLALQGVVAALVTIALLREDSVFGTRQFWTTRPISKWRLLAAKAVGATVLLWLVPIAPSLPWWLWCGFGLDHIIEASLETGAFVGLIAIPAATVALVTDSFARSVLWTLVVALVALTSIPLFWNPSYSVVRSNVTIWHGEWVAGIVMLELLALIVARFVARHRIFPIIALGVVMIGSVWAMCRVPLSWLSKPAEYHSGRAAEVNFQSVGLVGFMETARTGKSEETRVGRVNALLAAEGVPDGAHLSDAMGSITFRWPDGQVTSAMGRFASRDNLGIPTLPGLTGPNDDPETVAWHAKERAEFEEKRRAAGIQNTRKSLPNSMPARTMTATSVVVARTSLADFNRIQTEHPAVAVKLWPALIRPELVNEQPLKPGVWHAGSGYGLRILELRDRACTLVETRRVSWLAKPPVQLRRPDAELMLINRDRGEWHPLNPGEKRRSIAINHVEISWWMAQLVGPKVIRDGRWVERPGWLDNAALGELVQDPISIFRRELTITEPMTVAPHRAK